ncbi:hypothetical protein KJ758_02470, partial [Patescibacteria group bacterium]|nr:hypothetical protein [Patescibacteria group bacterium]
MEGSGSKFEFMHEMPKEAESKDFDLGEISKSDHRKKAEELIGGGESELVAQHLDQFAYLDHKHIANLILEQGNDFILAKYLNNFEDLDQSIADKLIKAGEGKSVVKNISSFNVLEHRHIAERLINAGEGAIVAENLEKFYHDLDYKDLAKKLIKKGQIESLGKYLEKFQGLDAEIAEKLCRESVSFHIAENISSFSPLDHRKIADILIGWMDSWQLVENLEKFQVIDYQEIALSIINRLGSSSGIVAEHLDKFKGVDRLLIADEMVKHSAGDRVLEFLENFGGLKAIDVVRKMMSAGDDMSVAFECFSYLSEEEKKEIAVPLADRLIKTGHSYEVPILFNSLPSLNREEVAQKLMIAKDGVVILEQSDKFPGMDLIEVAKVIIAEGQV